MAIQFDVEATDNASPVMDRIYNRFKSLKGEYREMRRNLGDMRQGLNVMSGMGMGFATQLLQSSGMKEVKEEKDTKVKTSMTPLGNIASNFATTTSMLGGGIAASMVMENLGQSIAKSAISTSMGGVGKAVSAVAGLLTTGASIFGRFAGGAAGMAGAMAIQYANEALIQPNIEKIFNKKEYSSEYVKKMSQEYLSDRKRTDKDIYDITTKGYSGQELLWSIGSRYESEQNMKYQVEKQKVDVIADVSRSLYLQNRE